MTTIIHINRNIIQHNSKYGKTLPVCRVEINGTVHYCMEIDIKGTSKMVYRPDAPRPCGAKLWIETDSPVEMIGERNWNDIKDSMKDIS